MMFLFGSIALAGPNWLPLPQFFGRDIGPSQTAWQPTAHVGCSALTVSMRAPLEDQSLLPEVFLIENFNGFEEYFTGRYLAMDSAKWYITGLYDFDGNLIPTSINSPELLMDFVPAQDEGTTVTKSFTIDTPLRPGQRVYLETYYEVAGRIYDMTKGEDPEDPNSPSTPYSETNINNKDTIGDSEYPDRYIRVYDRAFSAEDATNNAREYACSDNSAAPTLQMSLEGGLAQNEGDTTRDLSYSLNLVDGNGNPTTTNQDVWAYVEVDVVTDDPRLGDYDRPMWTGDSTINGVGDFTVFDNSTGTPVEMQDTEDIAVRYIHADNSDQCGGAYCDVIPSNPAEIVRVYIPAGQSSGDFTVRIFGDLKPETDELISFELLGASHAKMPERRTQLLVLLDDDQPLVSIDDVTGSLCSVPEGNSETFTFPVSIPEAIEGQVELEYTTSFQGTTLEAYLEYTPIPADPQDIYSARGDYTDIPSGTTTTTAQIDILRDTSYRGSNFNATGDTLVMNLDRWQDVEIERGGFEFYVPAGVRFREGDMSATLTILPWGPEVSVSDATLVEGDSGQQFIEFTLTLAEAAVESGNIPQDITVAYRTVDGTALAGQDYVATNGTVTFGAVPDDPNPPAFEPTTTVQIPIIGDELVENNETFMLELVHEDSSGICVSETAGAATGTITDDDPPTLTVNAVSASEADGILAFTLMLDAASGRDISVGYSTTGISATADEDFTATSGTLNFANGETEQTVEVPLNDDNIWEDGDETFTLDLSSSSDVILAVTSVTGTITDDDGVPVLTVEDAAAVENDGTIVFDLSLSNPSATATTWEYTTDDGTALAGEDYTFTRDSVTIPALATTAQVSVPVLDDDLYEPTETFTLVFPGDINDLFRVDAATQLTDVSATGTITDDDTVPVISLTGDASDFESAGTLTFTVTTSALAADPISFDYTTTDGTALAGTHYTATTGNTNIASGMTQTSIEVMLTDDAVANEDRTFTFSISDPSLGTLGTTAVTGTIQNDDTALTVTDASASETAGQLTFTVTKSGYDGAVSVNYATADGTALAGTHYTATSGTLNFAIGETSATINVPISDDNLANEDRTLTLNLSAPVDAYLAQASATGTIINDDTAISITDASANEADGQMTFTVTRSGVAQAVTFDYATADDTATAGTHYAATSGSTSIAANATETTINVPLIDDNVTNVDRTFTLTLSNASGVGIAQGSATGTIVNDDALSDVPTQLTQTGATDVAPLELIFGWQHQATIGVDDVAGDWYNVVVYRGAQVFVDEWRQASTLCTGITCEFTLVDDYPYDLLDGSYEWLVQASVGSDILTSATQTLTINMGVPSAPVIADASYGGGDLTVDFNSDDAATWYNVLVEDSSGAAVLNAWVEKSAICTGATCTVVEGLGVAAGTYSVEVGAWGPNSTGLGTRSATTSLTITGTAPALLTGLSVTNETYGQPLFTWAADPAASYYRVWIGTADYTRTSYFQWNSAASLSCGSGTCTLDPALNLIGGTYTWFAQAWGPGGYNNNDINGWVQGPNFTVTSTAPGLVSGLNVIDADTGSPSVTWTGDPAATWYQIWMGLADGSSTAFYGWTSAADLDCTTGTCTFAPDVALGNGTYAIYAQAWGPGGFNNNDQNGWAGTDFAVGAPAPTAPTLIAPASSATVPSVPEFRWNAVSGATWYHLEVVQQPTATRASATIDLWMNAADFGCHDNICELIPTTPLATGSYEWRVQAYSPAGLGAWSLVSAFNIN